MSGSNKRKIYSTLTGTFVSTHGNIFFCMCVCARCKCNTGKWSYATLTSTRLGLSTLLYRFDEKYYCACLQQQQLRQVTHTGAHTKLAPSLHQVYNKHSTQYIYQRLHLVKTYRETTPVMAAGLGSPSRLAEMKDIGFLGSRRMM